MAEDYNKTINLPKTDFPMRASLAQREPGFLERWQRSDLYHKAEERNEGHPRFILMDGPPFSNGMIHMGTALNKVLKDFVVRYKSMRGFYAPFIPGWDNHGMPIESAIIKKQKLDHTKMTVPEFREACKAFAMDFVNKQREQFIRLGVIADWEHPYLTMDPGFEAEEIRVFGKMFEKGYIYKGLKPVYWCTRDETALAEAEIEYQDDPCDSIYVKFALKDGKGLFDKFENVDFLIWTTTAWSLPGNLAITVNPDETYLLLATDNGNLIVAEKLSEKVLKAGNTEGRVLASFKGDELEGCVAVNPLFERDSVVCLGDYVTMDTGSGCVHTAPGFGVDDYLTGKKYGLDVLVPIDDKGIMTEDAHQFAGMFYLKAASEIMDQLAASGRLYATEKVTHNYPHCWRCKEPVLYRATSQWFCSVESFKDKAVDAAHTVRWMPDWGENRICGMIQDRSDWCISRQRNWGLPIPVFYCADCGETICNSETIENVAGIFGEHGSNYWFSHEAEELLPKGFRCPKCGGVHFTKDTNTLDGWFDSGSVHYAHLRKRDESHWPCDLILEGADQYRGWFQSTMLTSVGALDSGAPYRSVITHGWVVDGEGKAMHKSLGNTVDPLDVIKTYGADVLRLWVASSDYTADVRVSKEIFAQLSQAYLKIRNTMRYILGNLDGFDPDLQAGADELTELDKWALSRTDALIKKCLKAYDEYDFHVVYHSIYDFCVVDMSNFYLDIIKDRLYCDDPASASRRGAQTAIYKILSAMDRLLAPILCFTADEVWQSMPHESADNAENVLLNDMPTGVEGYCLDDAAMAEWDKLIQLRANINVALEAARADKLIGKSLEADVRIGCGEDFSKWLCGREDLLKTLLIVSKLELTDEPQPFACADFEGVTVSVAHAEGKKCLRCWTYDDSVGQDPDHPDLCARCASAVRKI